MITALYFDEWTIGAVHQLFRRVVLHQDAVSVGGALILMVNILARVFPMHFGGWHKVD